MQTYDDQTCSEIGKEFKMMNLEMANNMNETFRLLQNVMLQNVCNIFLLLGFIFDFPSSNQIVK